VSDEAGQLTPEYVEANPRAEVPALIDGDNAASMSGTEKAASA
jgi:glutathione S-transferase